MYATVEVSINALSLSLIHRNILDRVSFLRMQWFCKSLCRCGGERGKSYCNTRNSIAREGRSKYPKAKLL